MRLTLAIENLSSLPDGGPLSVTVTGQRGLDIGRDQYLDWTLPDPTRFISGKHCEVRAQNGEYLLYDVSTNGTLLNGSEHRMQSPHRLRTGDRLGIGHYVIGVTVETGLVQGEPAGPVAARPASYSEIWAPEGDIADPINPNELKPRGQSRPAHGDWIDRASDVPIPVASPASTLQPLPPVQAPRSGLDWAPESARPPAPAPAPPAAPPNPRRVVSPERGTPWASDDSAVSSAQILTRSDERPVEFVSRNTDRAPEMPRMPHATWTLDESSPAAKDRSVPAKNASGEERAAAENSSSAQEFVRVFAAAAGIPESALDRDNPAELAKRLGGLVRLMVVEMRQMLGARSEAKRMARSSAQTVLQALDNNPLKFSPTDDDALRCLLGPPLRSYLDAQRAIGQGFSDLKSHQVRTYAAMQQAVRLLAEDLDPAEVDKNLPADAGLSAMLASRKSRLWDTYVTRWHAKTDRHDDGLVDVFMQYFADCYDRIEGGR